jgi:F-type H+-transporting ATPase subunit b
MIDLNITFFIQLLNFLIILFVLNYILYRPIRGIIKRRTDLMAGQLNDIERFTSQAKAKMTNYDTALNEARKQGKDIRGQYREQGYAAEKGIVEAAAKDAAAKLGASREEIAKNKQSAQSALMGKVERYAQLATEKILGRA